MSLSRFLSGTHVGTDTTKLVLSGVTKIIVTPWTYSAQTGAWTLTPSTAGIYLDNIIADTVTISQDDPSESSIDCETRDEPIKKVVTNGSYNIEMTSADIQKEILVKLFGYTEDSTNGRIYAPASYKEMYVAMELTFGGEGTETTSLVCPKVQISSKIDASSLKSETVKGTISGTLMSYAFDNYSTPFFVNVKQAG